jgi:hypothetical protein
MAGVVVESAGKVRQKAYNAVYGTGVGTAVDSVSPYHFYAIKAFFLHMAANKSNPDLQYIPYSAEQIIASGGYQPLGAGAATLYVWFMKARRSSATTASFQQIFDATDNTTATATIVTQQINLTGQQALFVWPNGFPVATEITIAADTTVEGGTESTAALSTDGFLIVGA